jgi:uncharacterized protein
LRGRARRIISRNSIPPRFLSLPSRPSLPVPLRAGASGPDIYVDADACPVKDAIIRVAARHGLRVILVSNQWLRGPDHPLIRRIVVPPGIDAADERIAAEVRAGDIVVTADVPLAKSCLDKGARVLGPTGRPFTEASIGMALAMRDLTAHLRDTGEASGGPLPFGKHDRSRFLSALEEIVQAIRREKR